MGGVTVIATGAGVHGGDEHKGAGVFHIILGTADSDLTILQRLAQHL